MINQTPLLVLGSSSKARYDLLTRLKIPFITSYPDIDESPLPEENIQQTVLRLAEEKAKKVAVSYPNGLIIGCDQLGIVDHLVLGKPLNYENAVAQLHFNSGKKITFYTGICLLNAKTNEYQSAIESYDVYIRHLTTAEIEYYLKNEEVLQCAGSLRIEGLGITLVERLSGDDYTTLIGLPLIRLTSMLKNLHFY